ncbi:MAG: segregation/condensation protein A [Candidatus Micrarchaeaceae archaeon]
MATRELEANFASAGTLDLQKLVREATWRELLVSLVETNQIDPWDIDISKLVEGYLSAIKSMKLMDLRMPANFSLAAAILLKMKSERVNIFDERGEAEDVQEDQIQQRPQVDVPELVSKARIKPSRKVTLAELMDALEEAMKLEKKSMSVSRAEVPVKLELDKEDIDKKINGAMDLIRRNADSEGLVVLGSLAKLYGSMQEMLFSLFIPILFLASRGEIGILQEEFFGDIFIKILGGA